MRLFHVSEEADITVFHPSLPTRTDLDPAVGLVWAIDEARLPNFLTPRDCPRVTYHIGENTTEAVRAAQKKIDQAVAKGLLHKNTAARKKAALAKKANG